MKLGFVCGLADERRVIEDRDGGAQGLIAVTGADPARALPLARGLIAQGATHLVSFGLAGALDPDLETGALVVAHRVATRTQRYDGDAAWADEVVRAMTAAEIAVHGGTVYGADLPILSPQHKRTLRADTGAAVVDMESAAVAQACAAMKVPFIVVRAVSDDADSSVPAYASEAIEEDGTPDVWSVLGGLALDPLSLPQLIGVAAGAYHGYASLRKAAPYLHGPALQQ